MDIDLRTCTRCLLYEMPNAERYKNLYDYIAHIDEDLKVSDQVYQERLASCKKCDNLLEGMCRVCGCYVEMRAVMKQRNCPSPNHYW